MNWSKNKNKTIAFVVAGLFVLTGTYNAVVINSDSDLGSQVKFVKRLDEVYGVTVSGRQVASSTSWQKLGPAKIIPQKNVQIAVSEKQVIPSAASVESIPAAAVQEELTLSLVEVINPKKWEKGVAPDQFNGSLSTSNGVIENLVVSLPGGEGVSVSFSEMSGNVFEYDLNGEQFAGMMYQVDQNAYMVTLTNGPLEGTRLRFSANSPAVEQIVTQEALAENNIEVGSFGAEVVETQEVAVDTAVTEQPQGFNFGTMAL